MYIYIYKCIYKPKERLKLAQVFVKQSIGSSQQAYVVQTTCWSLSTSTDA